MKISLIISTYNWEEALTLCLKSVLSQTILPHEVIIADDGSTGKTKLVIDTFREQFPCPLIHVWQEDAGFRLAMIRNKAIAACKGVYIIQIDGDIILHSKFIEDHINTAAKGYFVVGSRIKLSPAKTQTLLINRNTHISLFHSGIRRRLNGLRCPFLSPFFYRYKNKQLTGRGCHMAYWKEDVVKINGFNEEFVGYGREDTDIIYRFLQKGLKKRFIKFKAIEYHLYHQNGNIVASNDEILNLTHKNKVVICEKGINQYTLKEEHKR